MLFPRSQAAICSEEAKNMPQNSSWPVSVPSVKLRARAFLYLRPRTSSNSRTPTSGPASRR